MEKVIVKKKWNPTAIIAPVPPILVTCGTVEKPNALTIAWTGTINTKPAKTYISVRPERFSYEIIKKSGEFVINLPVKSIVKAIDYCGCVSGKKEDKLKKCKLTVSQGQEVSAPILDQSPVNIECKVIDIIPLGTHDMFLAEVVCVNVDESLLDKKGRLALEKAGLIAYAHGQYFELGKIVGKFGYSVQKNGKRR
ncbi:MAG: flavin reductase family protein [Clostridia bacterium]